MLKPLWLLVVLVALCTPLLAAGELVRSVRNKLSAGDTASSAALIEDYKRKNGVDAEYLEALGWLARGAEMLKRNDLAASCVAELRREIREEKETLLAALGAAIEVEGKLLAAQKGRDQAVRFLEGEFVRAKNTGLRSRIRRTINALSLTGQVAPEMVTTNMIGNAPANLAALKGQPVMLFLWAHWCGDCRAQAATLANVVKKYSAQGLVTLAPTRFYGEGAGGKDATPEQEKAHIAKVWAESYKGLESVAITIDTETMVRYGVAATPTFVLIDRKGKVRLYAPTRLTEGELAQQIEAILSK